MALYVAISIAVFATLNAFVKTSTHTITSLFGATAFAIFYTEVARKVLGGPDALDDRLLGRRDRPRRDLVRAHHPQGEAVPGEGGRQARRALGHGRHRRSDRADPRQRPARRRRRRPGGHVPAGQQAHRAQAGDEPAGDRRGQRDGDRGRLPDGHLRRRPGGDQGRDELHVGDLRRREGHARAPRVRREHPDGVLRARHGPGLGRADAGQGVRAAAEPGPRLQLRQERRAHRRARQRHRRRHRRRSRAPAPSRRPDRPDRRGAAPPLQPHGHQPARLRPQRHAGALPQPGQVVRRAGDQHVAEHARAVHRPYAAPGGAGHGGEARLRPPDPGDRLPRLRPADRGLRRCPARACCARRRTRWRCVRTRNGSARSAASWPAAACSASRPRTRCTSSGSRRPCSNAAPDC